MTANPRHTGEDGFSLIELMVALSILMVGLLGLAQVFYFGLSIVGSSSSQLIAREKAREAIESVHTARDTRTITWAQIRNATTPDCSAWPTTTASGGGTFLTAEHDLKEAGPDGLVATTDDIGTEKTPGLDNLLGTADDIPIQGFRRQIVICDIGVNLRQIAVTIKYTTNAAVGNRQRTYTLVTYISSFS
ncbi:MAG: prepilin-type N-terminal cleavage/methylation domain-containing protein [Vicinamibacteraceae bacterium]